MAKSIPQKELEFIFNSIKSDSNEIHWSFFVSEAKQHIINSLTLFRKEDQCRSHWMGYFSNEVAKLGYKPNIGLGNWFIIQKHAGEHCKSSSATSLSSMPPPPTSPMIPPMSPISTHQTQASDSNSTSRSASTLGTLLSDSKRQAALYHYDNMQNDKR
ncbi:hypothetical protein HMPREF1544_02659 [Mucor circinelloides 1006PhL]|uniref:Myb-like domain-containing protein n=1 Tax=Mucor circinelloides f. circinelloides (strain 1006PhL) TaxID=1220926 RepID=S2JJJ5_MUCC1|nr:hypothetical protein HMPREF1544_02659 [Mucor circinelloides 1006PhL]